MCAYYDDPETSWGHISVTEPDPQLDEPPTPDEGEILSINLESTYTCSDRHWRRCQRCPKTVCLAEPHIRAAVQLTTTYHPTSHRAFFCSKECLYEWVTRR